MKQRNTPLFLSLGILLITTIIVAIFGVVPLPEYEILQNEEGLKGKFNSSRTRHYGRMYFIN